MLTDTHCHFEDERYEIDRDEVVASNLTKLAFAINVTTDIKDFEPTLQLAQNHSNLYVALGVHPHYSLRLTPQEVKETIENILKQPQADKVVAIGECGFDYYWANQDLEGRTEYEVRQAQAELFQVQIDLAKNNDLPIIIHTRDAVDGWDAYVDCYEALEKSGLKRGSIHSFSGDLKIAQKFLDLGFHLGISGILTFDKTGKLAEVVAQTDLSRLLLETDAPYLTPIPFRGKRNEPTNTQYIAEKIAELKNISVEEVLKVTEQNARGLFGI